MLAMGSKRRRAMSSSSTDACGKKAKADGLESTLDTSDSSESSTPTRGSEKNCNAAEDIIQTVLGNLHSIRNHPAGVESDVIQAVTQLERALRRARPSIPTGDGNIVSNALGSFHMCRGERLPALPRIMDEELEMAVFTHPGVNGSVKATYDRLEILGDAYIELIATRLVWHKFQEISSGRISQIRELLVKNETLSDYATKYGFDTKASIPQEYLTQPKRWMKTKGDIFEAYVAAVILSNPSAGYSIAERWLVELWLPKLSTIETPPSSLQAKEALAKKIMGKGVKLKYLDERPPVQQEKGKQIFFIGVYLTGWGWTNKHLGSGHGLNKGIAGNEAAQNALLNTGLIDEIVVAKGKYELRKI